MNTTSRGSTVTASLARARGSIPVLVVSLWSASYTLLGLLWALGGPGYPFSAGTSAAPSTTVLGLLPQTVGASTLAGLAVLSGILAVLLARRRYPPAVSPGSAPATPAVTAVLAVTAGLLLAVLLTDSRILTTMGYLPMIIGAVLTGNLDPAKVAALMNWPSLNLLIMMVAGLSLAFLGMSRLLPRLRRASPERALRVGQGAVIVAVAVPVVYAATRLGWVLGIPVGISDEFLASIEHITPIGAGLATFGLLGAVLTTGLVRPWGEVWPRWVPFLRGRAVPVRLPVYAAVAVAVPIASAGLMFIRLVLRGEQFGPPGAASQPGAWLPEMLWPLWGAALTVAAVAYLVRRGHGLYLTGQGR